VRIWRVCLSIRFKVLALVLVIVIGAVVTYLMLAISLFKADKLAYVYDLNGTLAGTLAEEVELANQCMAERLQDFFAIVPGEALAAAPESTFVPASRGRRGQTRRATGAPPISSSAASQIVDAAARRLFAANEDALQLEIWRPAAERSYRRVLRWYDAKRLASIDVLPERLEAARKTEALPWSTVLAEKLVLQNSSLGPDLPLLSLAILAADGRSIVVVRFKPDRLLRLLAGANIYTAYLVDRQGDVVLHPESELLFGHATLRSLPIVRDATEQQARRGVHAFVAEGGQQFIGAFARIDAQHSAVITTVPTDEALAGARQLIRKSVLFAIGILFVCVLASIFYSRQLTAPLRRLQEATQALSTGNFDIAVAVSGTDEVGRLGEAFNGMAQELRDRERRLTDAQQQLLQSSKLAVIGEMAAGISHEVKNPMVGMRGFAQLGRKSSSIEEAHEYFELIEKETTRAAEILENLLKFSRKGPPTLVRLALNDLVSDAIRLVRHQLQTKSVRLEVTLGDGVPAIMGDANQLQQVLLNLMINAEHALAGVKEASLSVSTARCDGGEARIVVRDNGVGMTAEVKAKLFRAFHTTKASGTGLGLSVSHRIIDEHQGRIEVESEVGRGTSFTIFLPPAPPVQLQAPEQHSA
jgi:two-component system, NtrC family, sensor kinase